MGSPARDPCRLYLLKQQHCTHSADCRSLQDTALFYSQCRTLPSDMESESQICEMLDLRFDVKEYSDRLTL